MKKIKNTNCKSIAAFVVITIATISILISCTKTQSVQTDGINVSSSQDFALQNGEVYETVYIDNPTGTRKLKCKLFIPASDTALPAVVVQHGCGGQWSNGDTTSQNLNLQFTQWVDSFRIHRIAAIFVDSYSARDTSKFCDIEPPKSLKIQPEYIRPRDAYAALNYLRTLARIKANKIALLGFSHGGTSVISTAVDDSYVARATPWTITYNGKIYTDTNGVLSPIARPIAGGFVASVSYYPGAAMYAYYGRSGTPSEGKYKPYTPLMIHAAGIDPLFTKKYRNYGGTLTDSLNAYDALKQRAILNGASFATNNQVELFVYAGAAHSFDEKTGGVDGNAAKEAKTRTINWLKQYLN